MLSILAAEEASSWSQVAAALLRFAEAELNGVAEAEVPSEDGEVMNVLVWGPRFGVSLRLQMQEEPTRGTRRFSLLLLLLRLRPNRAWSSLRRVHPMKESPAPLVVILRTNLSQFTVSTLVCHHRPLRGT